MLTETEARMIIREAVTIQQGSVDDAIALTEDIAYGMGLDDGDIKLLQETARKMSEPKPNSPKIAEAFSIGIERFARLGLNSVNRTNENR